MENKNGVKITARDRLLRAWENSMELVRDFETYSQEVEQDKKLSKIFAEFAEEEGIHASKFREILCEYQNNGQDGNSAF